MCNKDHTPGGESVSVSIQSSREGKHQRDQYQHSLGSPDSCEHTQQVGCFFFQTRQPDLVMPRWTEGSGPAKSAAQVCSHTFMCFPEGRGAAERVRELFKYSCLPKELLRPQKIDILKSFLVQGASRSCSHPSACAQLCGFMEQHSNSVWFESLIYATPLSGKEENVLTQIDGHGQMEDNSEVIVCYWKAKR